MNYKNVKAMMKNARFPLNLQFFADGDGAGAEGGNGGGASGESGEGGESGASGTGDEGTLSFEDFLKDTSNQAEFDRRVQKAVQTAVSNAQKKWTAITDDKLTEAEKLAQMTKEERAEYKATKLERELAELKKQNALSDMSKTARKMLAEEEITIPDEILTHLVSDNAEDTKASVEAFAKLFKSSVQSAVKDALKGNPPTAGTGGSTLTKAQIMAIKNPSERQRLIAENMKLFQ